MSGISGGLASLSGLPSLLVVFDSSVLIERIILLDYIFVTLNDIVYIYRGVCVCVTVITQTRKLSFKKHLNSSVILHDHCPSRHWGLIIFFHIVKKTEKL